MKRLFLLSTILAFGQNQAQSAPTLISFINMFGTCSVVGTNPAFPFWNGTKFVCATLGAGLTFNPATNVISVVAVPATPVWQVETVGFNGLATGATTFTYTTKQTPVAGVILFWYSSGNLFANTFGAVAFIGQPITITLPIGWLTTDAVTFVYASQ